MASSLIKHGVKQGDYVGLCLERSFELIISMLAILKAGGAYVPMDPAYPNDRLHYTCINSKIKLVLTNSENFPEIDNIELLNPYNLKLSDIDLSNEPVTFCQTGSDSSAYIIYTSGSSGKPKGVVVPHRNVISLLISTKDNFELSNNDVWTFFHSAAFDFSVWEIWGSLLTGATLIIVPYWISRSPQDFYALIKKSKVTILNQTPSAFSQFIHTDSKEEKINSLRLIIFGGEPLNTSMLKSWLEKYPESQCRLENMFGITETTVHVTSKTITRKEVLNCSKSVGKPLPGWYIHILDSDMNILPYGEEGEIYVGGAGVAKEYINQPELTSKSFIRDPFREGIMYKSGDKGRLLENGEIEHLGRLDSQVKLRGFRIELDEINNVITDIDNVNSSIVIFNQIDKNDPASARLDSYIVLNSKISTDKIIDRIKKILPDYMIPSTFTIIDKIPLTHNGKVDVGSLPEPVIKINDLDVVNEAGDLTGKMIEIWQDVLGCSVKKDDNFFNLGGNSLYAVRIAFAMSEAGLPELPLKELYTHQTIEKLLPYIKQSQC